MGAIFARPSGARFHKGVWYDENGAVERSVYEDLRDGKHNWRRLDRRVPLHEAPHRGFDGFYEDDVVTAFVPDTPCAAEHLLIVPRDNTLSSVRALTPDHLGLMHHLRAVAITQLRMRVARSDSPAHPAGRFEFSFHVPPFNSIDHLHLHAFALPFDSAARRVKYLPGTPWCQSWEHKMSRLERQTRPGAARMR